MPAGHLHRRLLGGGTQTFQSLLQTLGGSIVFYHPMTDAGPYGTTYPGSGTVSMPLGTMTNNTFGGAAVFDGRVTYQDGGFTSPEGVGVTKLATPGGVSTVIDCNDTGVNSTAVNVGGWYKAHTNEASTDILTISVSRAPTTLNIRVRPGSDTITMEFNASTDTWALDRSIIKAGMLLGFTAYNVAGPSTTTELYVNGVLIGSRTRAGSQQNSAQIHNAPTDGWNYQYSGSTHAGWISGHFYTKDVQYTAANWLTLYNAGK